MALEWPPGICRDKKGRETIGQLFVAPYKTYNRALRRFGGSPFGLSFLLGICHIWELKP